MALAVDCGCVTQIEREIPEYMLGYYIRFKPHGYNGGFALNESIADIGLERKIFPKLLDQLTLKLN